MYRWSALNLSFSTISAFLTGFEVFKTVTETLTPKIVLASNLVKLFGIAVSLIMDGLITGTTLNGWAEGTLVIHSLLV